MKKLNKKQKTFIEKIANLNRDINQAYDIGFEGQIAILIMANDLNVSKVIYEDYEDSINNLLNKLLNK
jgi:hypothetical protein